MDLQPGVPISEGDPQREFSGCLFHWSKSLPQSDSSKHSWQPENSSEKHGKDEQTDEDDLHSQFQIGLALPVQPETSKTPTSKAYVVSHRLKQLAKLRLFFRDEIERKARENELETFSELVKRQIEIDNRILRKERRRLEQELDQDHDIEC